MRQRLTRLVARIRATWAEMAYAQRRLLEIRTGLDVGARRDFRPPRPGATRPGAAPLIKQLA